MKDEYLRRHRDIWPEMVEMLKTAGVRNYTIWYCRDQLFGYYESEDMERVDAVKRASPVQARWQEYMADLISADDSASVPKPPEKVFEMN